MNPLGMIVVVRKPTESAAYLASARITANGGPVTDVRLTQSGWAVLADNGKDAEAARLILARVEEAFKS